MKDKIINLKFYIFLSLLIIWLAVIFLYSAKPGNESSEMSHNVGKLFGRIFVIGFEDWDLQKQEDFAARVDHPIRKTAHALEFGFLGFLSFMTLCYKKKNTNASETNQISDKNGQSTAAEKISKNQHKIKWKHALIAFAFTVFYACTDEFHQLFVEGRTGKITDVLIDSLGAIVFISVTAFILFSLEKKKDMRSSNN